MCNPDLKQVVRIRATLYTLYRFADQPGFFNVFLPRRNCEDASSSHSSPMKGPLKLVMKTPLHRPMDPSTHGPIRLAALVAAHLRKGILNRSDLQGSQVFALDSVLKFQREVHVWLNGEALPICHGNSYFNCPGFLPWES